jgi:citrate synthase
MNISNQSLYPNVDFYSGIIQSFRIPTDMFTVMFAIGRLPGGLRSGMRENKRAYW